MPEIFKSRGRITMNWSGTQMDWKVRYRRAPMQGYADTDTLTFARRESGNQPVRPEHFSVKENSRLKTMRFVKAVVGTFFVERDRVDAQLVH